ncbi:AAA family ATPase [Clostridium tyrobutyricum]|uniref:AAA family ATPase n=1 Tax=Clostridium tyrobutyricum TaxID=1519 RepID=UPI001C385191|nr:DUF2813 domain-containing protein [Clostridium tyrobutyricum]MBV4415126.1 AAA family ATPase [Clostridium tyrobutyricum]
MSKSIFLEKLSLRNFKGIKELNIDFSNITNIYGDNATGKTSIFDAFTWLLFDKDSQDRSKFDVQPLDENNNVIHMLETEVEAVLQIDEAKVFLKKMMKEKWVNPKGKPDAELKGVTTTYCIDDVPKKQREYKQKINDIIPEDIFKLITNPLYFSTNMKWQDRKKVLMDIIGEITDESIINSKKELDPLRELIQNKTIEEIKKSISASKKKLIKEKESIPPRVDEKRRELREDIDFDVLDFRKRGIVSGIKSIDAQLMDTSKINDELFDKKDKLYGLKSKLKDIEREEVSKAESGKDDIAQELTSLNGEIAELKFDIRSLESEKNNNLKMVKSLETDIKNLRAKWFEENKKVFELPENAKVCPLCKRPFDEEDIESHRQELEGNFNKNKAEILTDISQKGTDKSEELKKYQERADKNQSAVENANTRLATLNNKKVELQSKLDNFKITVNLDGNKEYQGTLKQIQQLEVELSKPVETNSQIEDLKTRKAKLQNELEEVNRNLSYEEINLKTKERIKELMDKEKQLAQQIADLENQDFMCDEFIKTKVKLMESSINSKFKYVKFRFFKTQVNGGIDEDCEPLIDGVPFSTNLNSGAKINAGIDIINTLANYYGIKAPIFIDNRESTTKLIDTESQIVNLVVSSSDKKLRIENDAEMSQTEMAS